MIYQRIKYFLKTMEAGNFSKAAARLYLSPQALTKQVSKLEEEIGGRLFERTPKGLVPTPLGLFAQKRFLEADAVFNQALGQVMQFAENEKPEIRIAFFNALPKDEIITPVVSFLIVNYPDCKVDFELLEMEEGRKKLLAGKTDLLITNMNDEEDWNGCRGYSFAGAEAKVIVSLNHPWVMKETITEEDMRTQTFLKLENDEQRRTSTDRDRFFENIPCRDILRVPNFFTLTELLKQGNAFAVSPMLFENADTMKIKAFPYPGGGIWFHAALMYCPAKAGPELDQIVNGIVEEFDLREVK